MMISLDLEKLPRHVAIIMDGNGRWAKKRGLNRVKGHRKGAEAVREVVRTSREIGIRWLTLYAFSEENWGRSRAEIAALMNLLKRFLEGELGELIANGIRLTAIGRIDKLPDGTRRTLLDTMSKTAGNKDMVLALALSYGGRQEITDAVRRIAREVQSGELTPEDVDEELLGRHLYLPDMPDPDLLIRTSGENRISNFLLWQLAYAELYMTPTLWPDFGKEEYLTALKDFQGRERRFGVA
jgi:undecaprenyl diphosphate synthase